MRLVYVFRFSSPFSELSLLTRVPWMRTESMSSTTRNSSLQQTTWETFMKIIGAIQVLRNTFFFCKFYTHPSPRIANNVRPCTFVIRADPYTPPLRYVTRERPLKGKGMILYSVVSIPLDHSNRSHFTSWQTCSFRHQLHFSGKHSATLHLLRND